MSILKYLNIKTGLYRLGQFSHQMSIGESTKFAHVCVVLWYIASFEIINLFEKDYPYLPYDIYQISLSFQNDPSNWTNVCVAEVGCK